MIGQVNHFYVLLCFIWHQLQSCMDLGAFVNRKSSENEIPGYPSAEVSSKLHLCSWARLPPMPELEKHASLFLATLHDCDPALTSWGGRAPPGGTKVDVSLQLACAETGAQGGRAGNQRLRDQIMNRPGRSVCTSASYSATLRLLVCEMEIVILSTCSL